MSLFRRKAAPQRPMISWPVDRPLGDFQNIPSPSPSPSPYPHPTLYSPIASSPSAEFSFAGLRWPLKDDIFNQNVTFPSPLQMGESASIILSVSPPPPPPLPPKQEMPPVRLEHVNSDLEKEIQVQGQAELVGEKERSENQEQVDQDWKDLQEGATRDSSPLPPPPPPTYRPVSTPEKSSSPPPIYEVEADIYRYMSRSPPMYKDDEDVYEDVYSNISPLRNTRGYENEAIRTIAKLRPISPLRPSRKLDNDIYNEISPLHLNPNSMCEEDLLEDLPLMRDSIYNEYEDADDGLSPLPPTVHSSSSTPLSWRSSRTSDLTMSTVATSLSANQPADDLFSSSSFRTKSNKSCNDYYCDFDFEDYFEHIQHEIDISDERPNDEKIAEAGKIPIFDSDGIGRPFASIYSGDTAIGEQQMVIFVRHFFCGACQAYLRSLSKAISLQTYFTLPKPTSITIIGLGSPELINSYRKRTNCPFPIYADPTKRLYKALGMNWTLRVGKNPDYMKAYGLTGKKWVMEQVKEMNTYEKKMRGRGGHMLWVGGEFLFRNNEVVWCHRMKSYRGHSEIDVIKKILDVED